MGVKVRLTANYDLTRFTGASRVVLKALKKYRIFLADKGSNLFISGTTDSRWKYGEPANSRQCLAMPLKQFRQEQSMDKVWGYASE